MTKLIKSVSVLFKAIVGIPLLIAGCTTDDVELSTSGGKENLVEITDPALGEYLVYNSQRTDAERLPGGTAVEVDGKFYLNIEKAATADNLYLVKNETQIKKLATAGLKTAEDKITNIDVLPYFTALKTLKITSNEIRELDITECREIETIEMNYNLVSVIDMTNATKLTRFRFGGTADGDEAYKLTSIDLSKCSALEHVYLKNQNIGADGFIIPENYANLTEIDMSGNPGVPFKVPSDLYSQLTTKNGVEEGSSNGSVVPEGFYEIPDLAFGEYLHYLVQQGSVPDGLVVAEAGKYKLNTAIAAQVTVLNVAKTAKIITTLTDAGLSTASTPISSADGLQYFTSLTEFTATSNNFTTPLPLTSLKNLEVLQVNTAGVSALDLSGNTRLRVLNCNGSSKYAKLKSIDLRTNTLLETLNLKNNELETIDLSGLHNLKEVDLSGNPGADFEIPSEIYNQLTSKAGVKPGDSPSASYAIADDAFGEYMMYLMSQGSLPAGLVERQSGRYYLNTAIAAQVTVLNVAKTAKIITTLTDAGLSTASTPISSADGLQYFTSLTEFTATSNNFTTPLPLTSLKNLEVLQVNTAGVSELDLSGNTRLRVLNCNGSSKYAKLKSIDLRTNTLLETLNLKNNELETIDLSGLHNLKEVDLSGNPGADFTIPAEIYNNLETHSGVKSE